MRVVARSKKYFAPRLCILAVWLGQTEVDQLQPPCGTNVSSRCALHAKEHLSYSRKQATTTSREA